MTAFESFRVSLIVSNFTYLLYHYCWIAANGLTIVIHVVASTGAAQTTAMGQSATVAARPSAVLRFKTADGRFRLIAADQG